MDVHQLEQLTPIQYLNKYCVITSRVKKLLYHRQYTKYREPKIDGIDSLEVCTLYFFPRVILYNFFFFWLIYGGLGFWVWGLIMGFWGRGFQLMGFGACGVGLLGFWVGALYINIKE